MRVTFSWLKEHLETAVPLAKLASHLTALGLEVENVDDCTIKFKGFVVGQIVHCERHPNTDKLQVCLVDCGSNDRIQAICGAPNARTGIKSVFALVGSRIPSNGQELKKKTIHGIESNGMLCSEHELGLSDCHDQIIELPANTRVGTSLVEALGLADPVIDINLTPNRADCAGVRGIARDLAAVGVGKLRPLNTVPVPGTFDSSIDIRLGLPPVAVSACPLFVGRTISGVRNGESPRWLRNRLIAVGLRPISALVDITNFFTIDRNRPLHVFDARMIAGNMLVVRLSKAGENFTSLTGKAYRLEDGMTVVADSSGIISLGGITGGKATSCTVDTDTVFLESALFDPVRTAVTGRCLAISSDARYRFERGIDPCTVFEGIEQATRMILELCGGNASTLVVAGNVPTWQRQIIFQTSQVLNLSGVDLPKTEQARILINLGFQVTEVGNGSTFAVDIPSWRVDIHSEADLVEEIIRVCGYDSIPSVPLPGTLNTSFPITLTHHHSTMLVKRVLAVRGLSEAVTWSFMDSSKAILFGSQDPGLHLQNPITNNLDVMRPSLLPNLMTAAVSSAARGQVNAALFEVGPSWTSPQPSGQQLVVGGLRAGDARSRHWAESARPVDVFDVKADALAVLSTLGVLISDLEITADAPRWYHPGRSGCLRQGSTVVAQFGEIHPAIIVAFDADRLLVGFEVFLNAVSRPREKKALLKLVPFQPIERDFAFIVDDSVTSDKVVNAARAADKILIVKVSVFDIYRGIGVPPNCKSIAITVTLQPVSGTLTDEQIGDVVHRIVESVNKQTGAILRG